MKSFDPQVILRPELAELKAYSPVQGAYEIRLDANEAPPLLSAAAKKKLAERAGKTLFHKYPESDHKDLKKAIAKFVSTKEHRVSPQQILAGVGSDEVISLLLTALARPKSKAPAPTLVTTTPTFVMYRLSARVRGQRVMEVPLDADWDLDVEAMLRAMEMAAPNVIFLATPNNPTGTMISRDRLERVISAATESLVVLDEAYIDYADRNHLDLLEKHENVAILRTLSKIGFAALRVGFLVGHPGLLQELEKVRLPYNLPSLSLELATLVLSELGEEIEATTSYVKKERERLAQSLAQLPGVSVIPSQANFLWLKLDSPAGEVFQKLGKRGVLVRSFHGRGGRLEQCIRVTIGTSDQNDRFHEALRESL